MTHPSWIKMRVDLAHDPCVVKLTALLRNRGVARDAAPFTAIGLLHRTWSLADGITADGVLEHYTEADLDEHVGFLGWASMLIKVGWLDPVDGDLFGGELGGLAIPNWGVHNGASAKARVENARRKRSSRGRPGGAEGVTKKRDASSSSSSSTPEPKAKGKEGAHDPRALYLDPRFADLGTDVGWSGPYEQFVEDCLDPSTKAALPTPRRQKVLAGWYRKGGPEWWAYAVEQALGRWKSPDIQYTPFGAERPRGQSGGNRDVDRRHANMRAFLEASGDTPLLGEGAA